MFSVFDQGVRLCDGFSRREALRVGGLSALGLSTSALKSPQLQAGIASTPRSGKAKAVILFWLLGGPPQHETWDPKPDAPEDVRGEFRAIQTKIPGFHVGELMPRSAEWVNDLAILRGVVSHDNAHSSSGYQMLTGVPHQPLTAENVTSKRPNLHPSLGAMVRKFMPENGGLPSSISLPYHIANDGEIVWPGQGAGFMGRNYDPWLIRCDPSRPDFKPPSIALSKEMSSMRFAERKRLLSELNSKMAALNGTNEVSAEAIYDDQAFDLLTESRTRDAFRIDKETKAVRESFGMSRFGQSCLLARRLVESGVKLVQVNWTRLKNAPNNGTWDTHTVHGVSLRNHLMPIADQAFSGLLNDLKERGMLEDTLVAWLGEFGHTPKFNKNAGRDHWGRCFSLALAGGGIQGGVVHGKSDKTASDPIEGKVQPMDITATILHCLGLPPSTEYFDDQGRPLPLSRGRVITEIL
ncbi:DUF1501 domain-containing protein [Pirellulaceae bacterium]|jgi:hypothetical protein|nr:DUF1501 domain-containing protein [Pirellulaceae bacterium]